MSNTLAMALQETYGQTGTSSFEEFEFLPLTSELLAPSSCNRKQQPATWSSSPADGASATVEPAGRTTCIDLGSLPFAKWSSGKIYLLSGKLVFPWESASYGAKPRVFHTPNSITKTHFLKIKVRGIWHCKRLTLSAVLCNQWHYSSFVIPSILSVGFSPMAKWPHGNASPGLNLLEVEELHCGTRMWLCSHLPLQNTSGFGNGGT